MLSTCVIFTVAMSFESMAATNSKLATRLVSLHQAKGGGTVWVGIGGGPGAGKSTVAAAVADQVNSAQGKECCVVLPMDGFHYSRAQLRELDPPDAASYLPRRGSPWTFDAEGLIECLTAAKRNGAATLPTYSRVKSDPVPGGVELKPSHEMVLVEGNYLLLEEDPRWAPLAKLWDEKWFVRCASATEQRQRLIGRHLETWNEEKTQRWGPGEVGAAARADANDVLNMELIAPSEKFSDLTIENL